ncbi:MAG: allophanate hydrolase, partial [Janthinobacterium lividum]
SALSVSELRSAYADGRCGPVAVIRSVLERIDAYHDPAVWISRVEPAVLLARAEALEADQAAQSLPLYGIPFAVKDNMDVAGMQTTAGCPAYAHPAERDATAVRRLLDAGAILVGKTNLDQFATGLVGTRSPFGAPSCVFSSAHISGGSSSGSAVAVAAGLVSFALGTDTAGSGRVPASFNNIVGLKPTRGLVSTAGILPACRSIDCVSIFAGDAAGAMQVLEVLSGLDEADSFTRRVPSTALPQQFRFGVLAGADLDCDPQTGVLYQAAIARLRALGGDPVVIDYAPFREAATLLYGGPFVAERLAAIRAFFADQAEAMDPVVRQIIGGGAGFSAVDVFTGIYRLKDLEREAARAWTAMDVFLLPTTPTIFTHAEIALDPIGNNGRLGLYTNFVNLLDYAAIAVPAGFRDDGLPAGVTLVGRAGSDNALSRLGAPLHAAAACGSGLERDLVLPEVPLPDREDTILLAVAGAHLSAMPLNHQLQALDASLAETTRTAPEYRLFALAGTMPPKPGLVRTPGFVGGGIEVELWRLSQAAFGRFVAALPQPMGIGKLALADGRLVPGFVCEGCALEGATDITGYGGWRSFVAARTLA